MGAAPGSTPRRLAAYRPSGPLRGDITVPGDKSISHRALMLGGLAAGKTQITGLLESQDVLGTAAAMRELGVHIERQADSTWHVHGRGLGCLAEPENVIDCGNSGTSARLLTGIVASHPITSVLTGDASLRRRPMRRVTNPLSSSGAKFYSRADGRLPLTIEGARQPLPIEHRMTVASAQVKSALLLSGLQSRGITRIHEPVPTRNHSEIMLRHFGAEVTVSADRDEIIEIVGQPSLRGADIAIPGDPSSAAFPIVACLLVPGSRVVIRAVGLNPRRAGLLSALREMNARLQIENERMQGGEPVGDIVVESSTLRGLDLAPDRVPSLIDELPILAVACAASVGTSRLRGLAELRVKESDRLSGTAALLSETGIRVTIDVDDLVIEGAGEMPPGGGLVVTRMDHRLAMSGLVLGCVSREPVMVDDITFIETSFPGFVTLMTKLGATFGEPNV